MKNTGPVNPASLNPVYRKRLWMHRIGITLSFLAMTIGICFLMWILFTLLVKGVGALSIAMFTETTPAPGSDGGGFVNAIVGSLLKLIPGVGSVIGGAINATTAIALTTAFGEAYIATLDALFAKHGGEPPSQQEVLDELRRHL